MNTEGQQTGILLNLVHRIATYKEPFTLFLDEYEVAQNEENDSILSELIRQLPHESRIVVAPRAMPDIGASRLRASGHLLDIGVDALRFNEEETGRFLELPHTPLLVTERTYEASESLQIEFLNVPADVGERLTHPTFSNKGCTMR